MDHRDPTTRSRGWRAVADDDQSISDEQQSFLLSGTSSLDGVDFRAATGIDAGNLGRSVVGTLGFVLAAVAATFVQGVTEAWTRVIDGLAGFLAGTQRLVESAPGAAQDTVTQELPGLIGTLAGSVTAGFRGAWSAAIPEFGVLQWVAALGVVILTFYAAARGFDAVSEVLGL